ncbi:MULTISPECIES: hypothetical protein, partial [Klebsiella]
GEISVKTGNNARNGGKNSLNRLIRCVCGKKIGPDPRNFNQRVSLGRNDLLIRTFPVIGGGTLATVSTYTLSCLMSAALELPRCCIVIANLSGSYVAQTKAIAEAISNLQQEASRQASTITPVQLAGTCSSLAPLRLDAGRFSLASRFDLPKYRRLHCPQSFRPGCYRPRLSG